jgi:hypothetical protein
VVPRSHADADIMVRSPEPAFYESVEAKKRFNYEVAIPKSRSPACSVNEAHMRTSLEINAFYYY